MISILYSIGSEWWQWSRQRKLKINRKRKKRKRKGQRAARGVRTEDCHMSTMGINSSDESIELSIQITCDDISHDSTAPTNRFHTNKQFIWESSIRPIGAHGYAAGSIAQCSLSLSIFILSSICCVYVPCQLSIIWLTNNIVHIIVVRSEIFIFPISIEIESTVRQRDNNQNFQLVLNKSNDQDCEHECVAAQRQTFHFYCIWQCAFAVMFII